MADGRGGDEGAAKVGVLSSAEGELRELAVDLAALDSTAKHEMVVAPGVVGTVCSAGCEGAAEFRGGEGGDALLDQEFLRGLVEGPYGLAELLEQNHLRFKLSAVGVEAVELAEENLASEAKLTPYGHDPGDSLQLVCEWIVCGERSEDFRVGQQVGHGVRVGVAAVEDGVAGLDQLQTVVEGEELLHAAGKRGRIVQRVERGHAA